MSRALLLGLAGLLTLTACRPSLDSAAPTTDPQAATDGEIADEMEAVLDRMRAVWYPRTIDETHGGFLSRFTYDWTPEEPQTKMIVTQARHVWTLSKLAERYPDDPLYARAAAHGFRFLRDVMWDDEYGGFYQLVTREGEPIPFDGTLGKTAYGNAFGVYALAAYTHLTGDPEALAFAQEAFRWLEAHSHDPEHGGYFQFLDRDGTPHPEGQGDTPPKDQNSSIHLLEALAELYPVWPDDLVRTRLLEMLHLVRDTITVDPGYLTLFHAPDWTPLSYRDSSAAVREAGYHLDHVSFGHDVETAFLMREASEALGGVEEERTAEVGKRMVDHALEHGWDPVGGFIDRGYYFAGVDSVTVLWDTKTWWAQAEALNTLSLMAELYPDDSHRYGEHFRTLWTYTQANLIDDVHGGWYSGGLDKEPEAEHGLKAQIWKGNYHTVRSLIRTIDRLRAGTSTP